jgi:hypothetical protein
MCVSAVTVLMAIMQALNAVFCDSSSAAAQAAYEMRGAREDADAIGTPLGGVHVAQRRRSVAVEVGMSERRPD